MQLPLVVRMLNPAYRAEHGTHTRARNHATLSVVTYSYFNNDEISGADYNYRTDESFTWDENGNPTGAGIVIGAGNRLINDGGGVAWPRRCGMVTLSQGERFEGWMPCSAGTPAKHVACFPSKSFSLPPPLLQLQNYVNMYSINCPFVSTLPATPLLSLPTHVPSEFLPRLTLIRPRAPCQHIKPSVDQENQARPLPPLDTTT